MTLVNRALKDRYIHISKKRDLVTYLPQGKERKLSNPEERVQLKTYLDLIYNYQYPPEKLRVCEKIKIGSSTREADIVVYNDFSGKDPFIIVECKRQNISRQTFEDAIDQGFSYAAVTRASYVWATSGSKHAVFEVYHDAIHERKRNRIRKIPHHNKLKRSSFAPGLRRKWRWLVNHPIVSDTVIYAVVLILSTLVFSKMAVEFHPQIYKYTQFLWEKYGMNFLWIFNSIVFLSTLFSLFFGRIFMRSHRLFGTPAIKRRVVMTMMALILFVPVWYVGTSNADPDWWTWQNFNSREHPIVMYLWPYVKSVPFQIAAIYALIWLLARDRK